MRPACACDGSTILLRGGQLVCSACGTALVDGTTKEFSTVRRSEYPPGRYSDDTRKARRQARQRIKAAGGRMVGTGKAAEWFIPVADYSRPKSRPTAKIVAPVVPMFGLLSDDEILSRAKAEKPTRATRRSA